MSVAILLVATVYVLTINFIPFKCIDTGINNFKADVVKRPDIPKSKRKSLSNLFTSASAAEDNSSPSHHHQCCNQRDDSLSLRLDSTTCGRRWPITSLGFSVCQPMVKAEFSRGILAGVAACVGRNSDWVLLCVSRDPVN